MTKESSKKVADEMLKLASEALEESKILLERDKLRGTISRAYYAMFDASRALLQQRSRN